MWCLTGVAASFWLSFLCLRAAVGRWQCVRICTLYTMAGRKRARETQANAEERAMKRIDRAVKRYGPSAVAKYYSGPSTFRPETKYFDCSFLVTRSNTVSWSNAYLAMTSYMNADGSTVSAYTDAAIIPSAIGNGYGQVVGNKYVIKKLKVRGTVFRDQIDTQSTVEGPTLYRIMLVQDTQPNGAQVDPATFLTDWGTSPEVINSFQSISSGSGGRIRILADRFIVVNPTAAVNNAAATTVSYATEKKQFSFSKTWKKGLKVVIKSGASTPAVASLSDCNIFLVCVASATDAATNVCTITGSTRCSYVD